MKPNIHDFSLESGERQVSTTLEGIRADHRNRYAFGLESIPGKGYGLDIFCGNGYGAHQISMAGHNVLAIDGSREAIELAQQHYETPNILFCHKLWPVRLPETAFDFAFCLESIEHLEDSEAFLRDILKALKPGGIIVLSTPNEDMMPFVPTQHKFHFRHFTKEQIFNLLQSHRLEILKRGGQTVYNITQEGKQTTLLSDAPVVEQTPGQFLIFCCRKP